MKSHKKIVLSFDLDNTLINNRKGIVKSFNYALRKFKLPELDREKIEKMIGIPLDHMFARSTNLNPSLLSSAFREYYGIKGVRPDLLYSDYAIEIQCSPIKFSEIKRGNSASTFIFFSGSL